VLPVFSVVKSGIYQREHREHGGSNQKDVFTVFLTGGREKVN
jgi:hypothetical protein